MASVSPSPFGVNRCVSTESLNGNIQRTEKRLCHRGVCAEVNSYYPDSGIDDNNWWKILAVGKAGARKDARSGLCPGEQHR
jgi:hypothetical protein